MKKRLRGKQRLGATKHCYSVMHIYYLFRGKMQLAWLYSKT